MSMFRHVNPHQYLVRWSNRAKFHLERFLLRGTLYRLLFLAAMIGLVSLAGGALIDLTLPEETGEANPYWWAFLRLTDPGYLGDDEGTWKRIVSTIITVLGYVLFMGALIATMVQWLNQTMGQLERGLTPVNIRNHVLVLGWTNRTAVIVRQLVQSEGRVQRFLERVRARRLNIVVLAESMRPEVVHQLREELGPLWKSATIIMRSGSPLRLEDLYRAAFLDAAAIILPATELAGQRGFQTDSQTIKTILAIEHAARQAKKRPPFVVAELFDARKLPIAAASYSGAIELLPGNEFIARILAHTIRHPGISHIFNELLTLGVGNEILVPPSEHAAGLCFRDLEGAFARGVLMGLVRPGEGDLIPYLNPPDEMVVQEQDRLVVLARNFDDARPLLSSMPGHGREQRRRIEAPLRPKCQVLLLGWNARGPSLLRELDSFASEQYHLTILSRISIAERERMMHDYSYRAQRLEIVQLDGDYVVPSDLEQLALDKFDRIVFLANDRFRTEEESDARTILGFLLVWDLLKDKGRRPEMLIELMDEDSEPLFSDYPVETLLSPRMLSHILSQVALRPELFTVYEELLGAVGPEIAFLQPCELDLETGKRTCFAAVKEAAANHGIVALGYRSAAADGAAGLEIKLNPPASEEFDLKQGDEVVVLLTAR